MTNMWMVRAGENAFLIDDFKKQNIIAIGWNLEDLSGKNPYEIKELMNKRYPEANKTSIGQNSGQVIKFVCDFKIGDYVISYNPQTRRYLIGKIASDYYYSNKLSERHNTGETYCHFRDVEWVGETKRDDLTKNSLKPLKSIMTLFNINDAAKNEILTKMNYGKIEWPKFYMEFADKLLEYKNNRKELISKIQNIYSELGMDLPKLEGDEEGGYKIPQDIDPFTIFALFNKHISTENRISIISQIKKEFSINAEVPQTFHGISSVNNLKATFYWFEEKRGKFDIDNIWELFETALNFTEEDDEKFISCYDKILPQAGIRWNVTMALNWIRPFEFINLDKNNRDLLSEDGIFSDDFKEEIKSLKEPPKGEQYLNICRECKLAIKNSEEYSNFPKLSHKAYVSKSKKNNDESDDGIGDNDIRQTHYWLISPGPRAVHWDEFYENGFIGIGFGEIGDLSQYESKEELNLKFQELHEDNTIHRNDVNACWQFVNDMQIGDVVFAKKGNGRIIGRGIIDSDYEYNIDNKFQKIRKVNWTHKGNWKYNLRDEKLPTKTLTDITIYQEMVNTIKELFVSEEDNVDEEQEQQYPNYDSNKFLEEVYIDDDTYKTLVNLVKNKRNLIVQGAPGVGKTFMAKRLAYSIMGVKDIERVMMVQFHQSYSYEDFVMGYRPMKEGFELRHGTFYKFCKKAQEDDENDYFFIIDEINRGNLSKIFGELFMLIENDKRGEKNKIQLLYSDESFFIPKNVHIIGLMNTADRSLAMMDYALRRRFAFFDLKPGFNSNGFKDYQRELSDETFDNLIEVIIELNQEIKDDETLGEGFRIGHSFLCNIKQDEVIEKINYLIEYEFIPLLKEYWFDEQDKIDYWSDRLRSVIN